MGFNGFISYSHAADGRLAPAVQRGLHRLAKPWHRRRALWIFRDQTGLAVTPGLWSSIQTALDGSEYFVLLSSPEAAQSHWVNREIEHWMATKSADRILPVVTDGEWAWDRELHDFTEDSTAVPAALRGVFAEEPLFLDLRWARGSEHLSLQHSRFRDAIAQLAAPMHGVSKDELEGEDVRQHRRTRRLRSGAVATLVVLTLLATLTSVSSVRNAERAKAAVAEALRQQQVAETQRSSAEQSAEEAKRQQELAKEQQVRAAAAAAEAKRSEQLAQEQQRLADRAKAEAQRQQQIADQAAKRTRVQQRLAREAAQRAQKLEQEAQRLAAEAQRLAKIAEENQRKAKEAAEEAAKQQAKAEHQQRIAISRRLTTQAKAVVGNEPKTALMLGAAAQEVLPDAATRSEVAGVVTSTSYAGTIDDVTSAVYGPGGVLATLGADGRVSLWNATNRTKPARITTFSDPGNISLTLSPDGRTLAVENSGGAVVLWDVADRSHPVRLVTVPTDGEVMAYAFSPDGITFATGERYGGTTVWDITERNRPLELTAYNPFHSRMPIDLAFSPDGRTLAVAGDLPTIFDLTDRTELVEIRNFPVSVNVMAFDPTGSILAVGGYDGTTTLVRLGRTAAARVAQDPIEPPAMPTEEPDDDDPVVPPPMPPGGPSGGPMVPPPMPPGGPSGGPMVPPPMPPDDPEYYVMKGITGAVNAITYSADGRYLAVGGPQGTAMVWDVTHVGGPRRVNTVRATGAINTVSFAPDAKTLITADSTATATVWNVRPPGTPDPLATLELGKIARAAAVRPDGRSLVVALHDGTAKSWNVTDPARPVRGSDLTIRAGYVVSAAFSPDGRTAAAVGPLENRQLTLTDLTRPGQPVVLPASIEASGRNAMVFSPDGRTLAVVAGPTRLLLWNVADRTRPVLLSTLSGGVNFGTVVAFSPDGHTLVTGGADRALTLWDVTDGSAPVRLSTLAGFAQPAWSVAFSPDGRTLASGGSDAMTLLWDVTDRARPHRTATLVGHTAGVITLVFSPDGSTLVTGDSDSEVILWDTANPAIPTQLASMRRPGGVEQVLFKPDGHTLAVVGYSNNDINDWDSPYHSIVRLFNYTKLNRLRADPATFACVSAGRGLDAGEWSRYIPEIPYRRTCTG